MGMRFAAIAWPVDDITSLVDDPQTLMATLKAAGDGVLDLDKAWHGWHWLLTGTVYDTDGTLGQALLGGSEIGEDFGYGAPRVLTPDAVRAVAEALAPFDERAAAAAYDPQAMDTAGIYPQVWTRDGEEGLRWLLHYLPALKAFYRHAAASGSAVVLLVL